MMMLTLALAAAVVTGPVTGGDHGQPFARSGIGAPH